MQNSIKVNRDIITVFMNYEKGFSVHLANIDTRAHRIYFNHGTEQYFNGVIDGREYVEWPVNNRGEKIYQGKFDSAVDFCPTELPKILSAITA